MFTLNLKQNNRACSAKLKQSRGFTIIETMISISLFLVIVMTGMGALLNANLLHQKSQDMRSIMDNLSFIMDDMSKNLRTGYNYHCIDSTDTLMNLDTPKSCANAGGIAFTSADGSKVFSYIILADASGGKIYKSTQLPYNILPPNPASEYVQLNSDEINISSLSSFLVLGAEPPNVGDKQQPFAIIKLIGNINYRNVITPFSIQTAVSQRLLDL